MLLTNHMNNVACMNKKSPNCWYCRAKVQWLHYITMQLTELNSISFDFAISIFYFLFYFPLTTHKDKTKK